MKLWTGRFAGEENKGVNDFNSSISFDSRMYREDIEGSIAHATMLSRQGIISPDDAGAICAELKKMLSELDSGALKIDPEAEDIHTFIEASLTGRIGDAGKRLHTARSRNDQVALDMRLYLKREIAKIIPLVTDLMKTVCACAKANLEAVMPGYTHLQRAQPVTFAHVLMAYAEMLRRDCTRLADCLRRGDECPLGAGALAGTTYPIDRVYTSELLGFRRPSPNSIDAVADRDMCIELCSALAIMMTHLSRFAEETILWCSHEFKFIELDDAFSTGSSIMPQKKNPDVSELVRGKTGRVIGDLTTLLTVMKGLPLAYNKDMQEDKEAVFDAIDAVKMCLPTFTGMIATMKVLPQNMRAAAAKGFINATDCADYLTKKGVPFRDAYKITGGLVAYCIEHDKTLETLSLDEYKKACDVFDEGIYEAIKLENCVAGRASLGGPTKERVAEHIAEIELFISETEFN